MTILAPLTMKSCVTICKLCIDKVYHIFRFTINPFYLSVYHTHMAIVLTKNKSHKIVYS